MIDPVSTLSKSGNELTAHSVAERLIDWSKADGITLVCTSLLDEMSSQTRRLGALQISKLADTWIHLNYLVQAGERNRGLSIIKSRGTAHSNQVRELILSDAGVTLTDTYTAGGEVLMGTLRWEKESAERVAHEVNEVAGKLKRVRLDAEEAELEVRVKSLQMELVAKQVEKALLVRSTQSREGELSRGRTRMQELRGADVGDFRAEMSRDEQTRPGSSSASMSRATRMNSVQAIANLTALCRAHLRGSTRDRSRGCVQGAEARAGRRYFHDADAGQAFAGASSKNRRHAQSDPTGIAGSGTGNRRRMNPVESNPLADANGEIASLIEMLHKTDQRLEELTAGEVDSVADRDGRTFLLRRAQDRLRLDEAAKQAAILNALPAHVALLDAQGLIVSVNDAWRRFDGGAAAPSPGLEVGVNYLEVCDRARGTGSSEAHQVAEGIRSVLDGRAERFSIEYLSHLPAQQRWFLLIVTPLSAERRNGAVVMHVDVTEERQAEENLRESERRFSDLLGNVQMVSVMLDREARITYCNEYLLRLTGWRHDEVMGRSWFELFVPPEATGLKETFAALLANLPDGMASRQRHRHALGRAPAHSLEQFGAAVGGGRCDRHRKHR